MERSAVSFYFTHTLSSARTQTEQNHLALGYVLHLVSGNHSFFHSLLVGLNVAVAYLFHSPRLRLIGYETVAVVWAYTD